jgi:hypothetical protein
LAACMETMLTSTVVFSGMWQLSVGVHTAGCDPVHIREYNIPPGTSTCKYLPYLASVALFWKKKNNWKRSRDPLREMITVL